MKESAVVQFKLNMPAKLREKLGEAASRSGRSLSSEMISRLEASLEGGNTLDNALANIDDAMNRIDRLERQMMDVMHRTGVRDYPGN